MAELGLDHLHRRSRPRGQRCVGVAQRMHRPRPRVARLSGRPQRYPPGMEPCPQCGDEVWGFMQQPRGRPLPTPPASVPSSHVMVFPCEHSVWLAIPQPEPT